jgi:hypothetical protein
MTDIAALRAELAQVKEEAAALAQYTPPPPATPNTDTGMTDHELAVASLARLGVSELDAYRQIAAEGLAAHSEGIASEAIRVRGAIAAQRAEELANSPEGREAAAQAIIAAKAANDRKYTLGRAVLEDQGLTTDDLDSLSHDEVIRFSQIEGAPTGFDTEASSFAANLTAAEAAGGLHND